MEQNKKRAKVIAISIQKGGVGKTTLTSNLGYVFAKNGYKVLLIDHDSQASLTGICNIDINSEDGVYGIANLYDSIAQRILPKNKEELIQYIQRPTYPSAKKVNGEIINEDIEFGFDLMPSDINLAEMEVYLARSVQKSGSILSVIIELIQRYLDYDYIFIDCAPGLTLGTYNAIAAAVDGIIVPCTLETMALRGVENLITKVAEAQMALGPNNIHKGILGIVMNQYVERRIVDKNLETEIKRFIPLKVFDTSIPESTQCKTATYLGMLYAQKYKKAEEAFTSLMNEIIEEEKRRENETQSYIVEVIGKKYEELHQEELKKNQ